MSSNWVLCGKFGKPHGIQGSVRLWPYNDNSAAFKVGVKVWVGQNEENLLPFLLKKVHKDPKGLIVSIENINDRDQAELLNHLECFISRDALPKLSEDEFYFTDLIGAIGVCEDGTQIGKLVDVFEAGAGDILSFVSENGKEIMIPHLPQFVKEVRVDEKKIIVTPLPGLLETEDK